VGSVVTSTGLPRRDLIHGGREEVISPRPRKHAIGGDFRGHSGVVG
jgi:hypothetical protein